MTERDQRDTKTERNWREMLEKNQEYILAILIFVLLLALIVAALTLPNVYSISLLIVSIVMICAYWTRIDSEKRESKPDKYC